MKPYKETHIRSIVKAISWRVFATVATILIVFFFTRKLTLSLEVGLVEVIVKLILFYFHERIWQFLGFGKVKHPLTELKINKPIEQPDVKIIESNLKELGYID